MPMRACTAEQMRAIDARAVSEYGMPSLLLMENAGRAVAERALAMLRDSPGADPSVLVFCGKGNNGGDGFVAARHLAARGVCVTCILSADRSDVEGDARANLDLLAPLKVRVLDITDYADSRTAPDLVIDALLGTGSKGAPRGPAGQSVDAINASGCPVLAVDIPSGLDSDTGMAPGACVRATETITLGLPKIGLVTGRGREFAGSLTVAQISLPLPLLQDDALECEWITADRARALWPARSEGAHKGNSGRVFVLAGSVGLTGAAALACEGALRAGAGLVTLGIPASLNDIMEVKLTEAMTLPLPETEGRAHCSESLELVRERLGGADALAAGPGFGRDPRSGELLRALFSECGVPAVVDADGLYLMSPAAGKAFPDRCVLTPHPGEMARLLGTEAGAVESNPLEAARALAEQSGCVVVLKGPGTVIASPDGRTGINSSGSPALATGGTGDLLTGILAACLARGLEPYEAAIAAVFLHGVAGEVAEERFGAPGAIAGDVRDSIPEALRRLRAGEIPAPCRIL